VLAWARGVLERGPDAVPLVYSTAAAAELAAVQAEAGAQRAGERVEQALAAIARALVADGVRRWVVAGGETSGAVVQALGVRALRIGPPICPGVPWTQSAQRQGTGDGGPLWLALKSGNFGGPDLFTAALAMA
jgi:uncharacterized protein YgbK (DUF1537 family)